MMGRGNKTYRQIITNVEGPGRSKKGRDSSLVEMRNRCIVHRYYYYSIIKKMRFDMLISELQNEFFLSAETLPRIIQMRIDELKAIKAKAPTVRQLRKQFPAFNWDGKECVYEKAERGVFVLSDCGDEEKK